GAVDGPQLFAYVRCNPVRFHDPTGRGAAEDLQALAEEAQRVSGVYARAAPGSVRPGPGVVPGRGSGVALGMGISQILLPWLYPRPAGRRFGEPPGVRALREHAEDLGIYDRASSRLNPGVRASGPVSRALADPKPEPETARGKDPKAPPRPKPT